MISIYNSITSKKAELYRPAWLIIGLLLLAYVLIRSITLSFTFDESLTFTIIDGNDTFIKNANNHWLNTVLIFGLSKVLGYSEVVLRLPNVLAFCLFLFFCIKTLSRYSTSILSAGLFFSFVLLNPYLLDFFSLSRGYGLAMGFLSGSLYFYNRALQGVTRARIAGIVLFGVLTIYANYSFITVILAIQLSFFTLQLPKRIKSLSFNRLSDLFKIFSAYEIILYVIFCLTLIPAILNVIVLRIDERLYFGGYKGVIQDTIFSVITSSLYTDQITSTIVIILIIAAVLFLSGFYFIKNELLRFYLVLIIYLLIIPEILFYAIGMAFPIERCALYWILIFGLYLLFLTEAALQSLNTKGNFLVIMVVALISVASVFNFFSNTSLKYTQDWAYESNTRNAIKIIEKDLDQDSSYLIGTDSNFGATLNYYKKLFNLTNVEKIDGYNTKNKFDYYYLTEENSKLVKQDSLKVMYRFEDTKTLVLKRL